MEISQSMKVLSFSLLLSLVLPPLISADFDPTKPTQKAVGMAVEGVVYCQSCKKIGTWSLADAKPIASAKISVICKNYRNQVRFYKAYTTNANGYFYAELVGYKMTHLAFDHPLQTCKVKLISSPLSDCNLLSNVNYGLSGSPLRYEDKVIVGKDYKAAVFAAGPLAFHPNKCL